MASAVHVLNKFLFDHPECIDDSLHQNRDLECLQGLPSPPLMLCLTNFLAKKWCKKELLDCLEARQSSLWLLLLEQLRFAETPADFSSERRNIRSKIGEISQKYQIIRGKITPLKVHTQKTQKT